MVSRRNFEVVWTDVFIWLTPVGSYDRSFQPRRFNSSVAHQKPPVRRLVGIPQFQEAPRVIAPASGKGERVGVPLADLIFNDLINLLKLQFGFGVDSLNFFLKR